MIEKLKEEIYEGGVIYFDENKKYYFSKSDYLLSNALNFCCCGLPEKILVYIRDFLEKIEKKERITSEDISQLFLLYWADREGLTEHGTAIFNSFLTEKGIDVLKDINWCIENEPCED